MVSNRKLMRVFVALVADNAADRLTLLLSPKNLACKAAKYAAILLSFGTSLVRAARLLSVRDVKAINTEINRLRFEFFVVLN